MLAQTLIVLSLPTLSKVVLSSYSVPGPGVWLEMGCSPCSLEVGSRPTSPRTSEVEEGNQECGQVSP